MVNGGGGIFERGFFGKTNQVAEVGGSGYTAGMWGEALVGVAVGVAAGAYWARPDLMVLVLIVIGVGIYGWRHPDLDDWMRH